MLDFTKPSGVIHRWNIAGECYGVTTSSNNLTNYTPKSPIVKFIPDGELRSAKIGDWYCSPSNGNGSIFMWNAESNSRLPVQIYTRVEEAQD